jgi:Fic-DOC domain mobile mystery protein B
MGRIGDYESKPGETPLDDASGLLPLYITTRKELDEAEFLNLSEATKFYLSNPSKINNFEIIREDLFDLHKKMFCNVWSWAGKKRTSNKNIGVDFFKIDEEIRKLEGDFKYWEKEKNDFIELIAKLHHRLVWIHPFEGGNGRWSRMVVNFIYYKQKKAFIKWPYEESSFRDKYLEALREADDHKFEKLLGVFKVLIKTLK